MPPLPPEFEPATTMQTVGHTNGDGQYAKGTNTIAARSSSFRVRIPSVLEALPYAPLSSIVPFSPDIVPLPLAYPSATPPVFFSHTQRHSAKRILETLNSEAANAERASQRLQKTLRDVQHLLETQDLPQYQLKIPLRLAGSLSRDQAGSAQPDSTPTATGSCKPQLGAFARTLLDTTSVSYIHQTHSFPQRLSKDARLSSEQHQPSPRPTTTPHNHPTLPDSTPSRNNTAFAQNARIPEPHDTQAVAAKQEPTPSQKLNRIPAVVVPRTLSSFERAEYQAYTETPVHSTPAATEPFSKSPAIAFSHPAVGLSHESTPAQKGLKTPLVVIPRVLDPSQHAEYPVHPEAPAPTSLSAVAPSLRTPMVVVPRSMNASQRAEYQAYPETAVQSRKEAAIDKETLRAIMDQRQKSSVHVNKLQDLINNILEAEDQLEPDTSGAVSTNAALFFASDDNPDSHTPALLLSVHIQLDKTLLKVANAGRLQDIPVEQLVRVQKLCDNAITIASAVSLGIGEDWSDSDIEDWRQRLATANRALQACKTVLRIMTACHDEKQLSSEETLRVLLEFFSQQITDIFIVPVVEMRADSPAFSIASSQKKPIYDEIVVTAQRVLKLLGDLLVKTDVNDSAITSVQFLCKTLIFVENAGSEKDSVLGIQEYESMRKIAMDVLSKVFARYPEQRQYIFDEILTSLEKLPVTRQSARQFKLQDAKPIQLVSALLMRLIQTTATRYELPKQKLRTAHKAKKHDPDSESDSEVEDGNASSVAMDPGTERDQITDLGSAARSLNSAAQHHTAYVVNYLVQRALASKKTGDEPYRNLLDIFIEDFLNVLGSTDWPAAEMFLAMLLSKLFQVVGDTRGGSGSYQAPAKAVALDLMTVMASGITDLQNNFQHAARAANHDESEIMNRLVQKYDNAISGDLEDSELLGFDGPYPVVLEYLQLRNISNDAQLQSARGYHAMQWAMQVLELEDRSSDDEFDEVFKKRLLSIIQDLETDLDFARAETKEARFASMFVTTRLKFCKALDRIIDTLSHFVTSDQALLRSKALRSVELLLEKSPALLDRGTVILNRIIQCSSDSSPKVRESAWNLLSRCLTLRPALDSHVYLAIIDRSSDPSVAVKKRLLKMLKDIYLRNDVETVRCNIAQAVIQQITDRETSIEELARQTFEEIWLAPLASTNGTHGGSAQAKLKLRQQTALIIKTIRNSPKVGPILLGVLKDLLSKNTKGQNVNNASCRRIVATMFEAVIDSNELPGDIPQHAILSTLRIFAEANPLLVEAKQLRSLVPYLKNLSNNDDLAVFRSAVSVFRYALPHTPNIQHTLATEVQQALIATFQKIPRPDLMEVAACLWMLDSVLKNTNRLVQIMVSILTGVNQRRNLDLNKDEKIAFTMRRLITITGCFGKEFNLDPHVADFKAKFPQFKGTAVSALAVDTLCPFTSPTQPPQVRQSALESVCMICEGWPKQFLRADVINAITLAFESREPQLETILLSAFESFYVNVEKSRDGEADVPTGTGVAAGTERLGNTYQASDRDNTMMSLAQRFQQQIIRVALTSTDQLALIAAQVIASLTRQGLIFPAGCGPCLIALGTSPDKRVAEVASKEHSSLNSRMESMFEKEHMRGVEQAYEYQHDVFHDELGFRGSPPVAKLQPFWEVLKIGSAKNRKKFFDHVCARMDFEPTKLDVSGDVPSHVQFVRFCVENLAFFDYIRVDELQHLVDAIWKRISGTGTGVAHAVESDVFHRKPDPQTASQPKLTDDNIAVAFPQDGLPAPALGPDRLRQLAVFCQIFYLLWELRAYLSRVWNLSKSAPARTKGGTKDANRAPVRIPNYHALTERHLNRNQEIISALETAESQHVICEKFVELMSIDHETKVPGDNGNDEDENAHLAAGYETPSESNSVKDGSVPPGSDGKRGRKRKSIGSGASTPRKKRAGSKRPGAGKKRDSGGGEDGSWD